jgi:hypothetical protein
MCRETSCTPSMEGCEMSMARLVVTAVLVEGRTRSEVARSYGVSRRWVITLVQRFLASLSILLCRRLVVGQMWPASRSG